MPVVVVTGARQTGKSTLVQRLTAQPRRFISFDELEIREVARRDPSALVGSPEPITIDEVQRDPDVLQAVKRDVDRNRQPGKFLLTGSAKPSADANCIRVARRKSWLPDASTNDAPRATRIR